MQNLGEMPATERPLSGDSGRKREVLQLIYTKSMCVCMKHNQVSLVFIFLKRKRIKEYFKNVLLDFILPVSGPQKPCS